MPIKEDTLDDLHALFVEHSNNLEKFREIVARKHPEVTTAELIEFEKQIEEFSKPAPVDGYIGERELTAEEIAVFDHPPSEVVSFTPGIVASSSGRDNRNTSISVSAIRTDSPVSVGAASPARDALDHGRDESRTDTRTTFRPVSQAAAAVPVTPHRSDSPDSSVSVRVDSPISVRAASPAHGGAGAVAGTELDRAIREGNYESIARAFREGVLFRGDGSVLSEDLAVERAKLILKEVGKEGAEKVAAILIGAPKSNFYSLGLILDGELRMGGVDDFLRDKGFKPRKTNYSGTFSGKELETALNREMHARDVALELCRTAVFDHTGRLMNEVEVKRSIDLIVGRFSTRSDEIVNEMMKQKFASDVGDVKPYEVVGNMLKEASLRAALSRSEVRAGTVAPQALPGAGRGVGQYKG
jgi:hypothetical protein